GAYPGGAADLLNNAGPGRGELDRGRAVGRGPECDGEQPDPEAVRRGEREDRPHVCDRDRECYGADHGAAADLEVRDADLRDERELDGAAVDPGADQSDSECVGDCGSG